MSSESTVTIQNLTNKQQAERRNRKKPKRDCIDIMVSILKTVASKGGIRIYHITRKSHMDHVRLKPYLAELYAFGLIDIKTTETKTCMTVSKHRKKKLTKQVKSFWITEKGMKLISLYYELIKLLK